MNHNIAGMPPSLSMPRGRNNMYFPCGGPGSEPPHMQRGPCFPLPHDDKIPGMPPGMACGMMGEFKSPLIEPPNPPLGGNPKKKRRTSSAVTPQQSPVHQDLMPSQPNTPGDTIVASNPFDDTPPQSSPSMMGHHMHMGMGMSPMHSPHMNIGPPMSSPMNNMGGMNMVGNPMSSPIGMASPMGSPHMIGMMNGGPMMGPNGPLGSPMSSGPSMIGPNGPMGSPAMMGPGMATMGPHSGPSNSSMGPNGPIGSPMSNANMNMMNSNMVGGPMTSPLAGPPMGSPMMGSPHLNVHNGPMGSPMTQTVMNCGPSPNSCVTPRCGPSPNNCPPNSSCSVGTMSCGPPSSTSQPAPPLGNNAVVNSSGSMNNNSNCAPSNMNCSANINCGPVPQNMCGTQPCGPCGPNTCGPRMNQCNMGPSGPGPMQMGPRGMMPPPPMGHMHMVGPGPHNFPSNMAPKPLPVSAGRVYPPDQPMVFNPQNPNAPPIYPCGICHKEVHDNDQAILCESGCNFWFHRMCTGLTEPAYQLLTAEVYAEWVCDKCLNSKSIPLVKFKP